MFRSLETFGIWYDSRCKPNVLPATFDDLYCRCVDKISKNVLWMTFVFLSFIGQTTANAQSVDSFNPTASSTVFALSLQTDGRILAAGSFTNIDGQGRNFITQLTTDGAIDSRFNASANGGINSIVVQPDGKIVAAGGFSQLDFSANQSSIGRLNSNGTLDSTLSAKTSAGFNGSSVQALALQRDGKILIGGFFISVNGISRTNICRLNTNGTVDLTFTNSGISGTFEQIFSLAVQNDDKILVGGSFNLIGGVARTNICRLNTNGLVDTNFLASANGTTFCLAIQPDGKILVGGAFTNLSGQACDRIGRLNTDGSFDVNFIAEADGSIISMAQQTDGKILVGGAFTNLDNQPCPYLGRLNPDGSFDSTFTSGANSNVFAVVLQPDGKVLVGGFFTKLGGANRSHIGRLNNTDIATNALTLDGSAITWLRGGTSPEVWRTIFDASTNGSTWTPLGTGVRIPGGWQLTNLGLPTNIVIRAKGFAVGGRGNSSGWIVETDYGPPLVTSQPVPRNINAGGTATFNVAAAGSPTLWYQWQKNGANLFDGGNVSGSQTPFLTLSNVLAADNGGYTAVITNDTGIITSAIATLSVRDPIISAQPTNLTVDSGNDARFSISAVGSPTLLYQWRIDGTNLPGANQITFTIPNTILANIGNQIDVIVSNSSGAVTSGVAFLTVNTATNDSVSPFNSTYSSFSPSIAQQTDGKILLGGDFFIQGNGIIFPQFSSLSRFNANGTIDRVLAPTGSVFPSSGFIAIQPDGRILAVTINGTSITRFNPDGSADTSFHVPSITGPCVSLSSAAIQSDGKIVFAGTFTAINSFGTTNVGRLNADGSVDTTFSVAGGSPCGPVNCLALQANDQILIGGNFTSINTNAVQGLTRLNSDGTVDGEFKAPAPNSFSSVSAVAIQANGQIIVAGSLESPFGQNVASLSRLNPDGSLDQTFRLQISGSISSIALMADGQILLAGGWVTSAGVQRSGLGRINSDGTIDFGFDPQIKNPNSLGPPGGPSCAVQFDGKILIGGAFSVVDGQSATSFARLVDTTVVPTNISYFDGTNIYWQQGGSFPEFLKTTFDYTLDGTNYVSLGAGQYLGTAWKSPTVSLPSTATVRMKGFINGGLNNGSTWYFETNIPAISQFPPHICNPRIWFGENSNAFGFDYIGSPGQTILIETSTNLIQWAPLLTNYTAGTGMYFENITSTNTPTRFYRTELK